MDNRKKTDELVIAYRELALQKEVREKSEAELIIANIERDFQIIEKQKRAAELIIANRERDFQNSEKEKRAAELLIANIERDFQIEEKEKRAAELMVANRELVIQNEEKEKRAAELIIANKELLIQNREKEKRAAELIIANKELAFQIQEKEKRAAELIIANKELAYQNKEKGKRAAELIIANMELAFQIKEKGERAAELIAANKELAFQNHQTELNKKKDEFIGLASHELKTPITSISAYLQFLERNLANDEKNKQLAVKALQQVGKLTQLVSDLLDVSKIESGKLPLSFRTFDMLDLLKEVIELMEYGNFTHKIKTNCNLNQLLVYADKQRIEQVMINLISNAIKYSPNANHIIISASETEEYVHISVQDFGFGIKEDQQAHIFSRFYRVEDLAPYISGLGIGLYISDDIITRHNSKLCVQSKVGAGAKFYFKLTKSADS